MSSEIATTNNQLMAADNRSLSLQEIHNDFKRFPWIGTIPREVAVSHMTNIVVNAFLYRGQQADPTNIEFIACSLVDELQSDQEQIGTTNLSFPEIARVVKSAVLTEDLYGISVASLYKVIVKYVKGEGSKIHTETCKAVKEERKRQMRDSIIAPMLQAYAGSLTKNSKV